MTDDLVEEEDVDERSGEDEFFGVFTRGLVAGGIFLAGVIFTLAGVTYGPTGFVGEPVDSSPESQGFRDAVAVYESEGVFNRSFSVYNRDRSMGVSCDVSRRDEVQISRDTFLYNESTSCSIQLPVEGNRSWSVEDVEGVDVFFQSRGSGEYRIGFDSSGSEFLACSLSGSDREKVSTGVFRYAGSTGCSVSSGSLYQRWGNSSFEDIRIHDQGRDVVRNRTTS